MTPVLTLKLTTEEVLLLASLASDQLFRREFIDPKMPGHRPNVAEVSKGKQLVERLRQEIDPQRARKIATTRAAAR